ncbi:MAG TPA: hypothetical protein VE338_07790 [Ktedonobacterales bacterium]|jgi:hypothetical protein|nr:hypothetical protein [Ktedonobacterales bacterium]
MYARMAKVGMAAALTLVIGLAAAAPAFAASPRARAAPAKVTESAKVVLDETSVNAPGFYADANLGATGVIAWAGTDSLHHINVMTSADGLHYGNKVKLNELTVNRPAVVQMSASAGKAVAIAWRGTDTAHRLNVMFDVYGARKALILNETSSTGPALTVYKGNLLLAWVGVDANHSLNILPITLSSFTPQTKTILRQFSSSAGPTLTVINKGSSSDLALGWITPARRLNLAQSTDGVHFTSALGPGLPQTSVSSPDALFFTSEGGPEYWLAWTGTDTNHHLNIQWTTHYPQWPSAASTKTVLPEWALGGPSLGFRDGVVIVWTGTDPAHHLNVARLEGF